MDITVHYGAVLVSTIVGMIIGWLWYSQALFGKQWMKAVDMSAEQMESATRQGMRAPLAAAFLWTLVLSYVLAHFVGFLDVRTVGGALELAFWVWLGFVAPITANGVIWERKSKTWWAILNGHAFVLLWVIAIILGYWR